MWIFYVVGWPKPQNVKGGALSKTVYTLYISIQYKFRYSFFNKNKQTTRRCYHLSTSITLKLATGDPPQKKSALCSLFTPLIKPWHKFVIILPTAGWQTLIFTYRGGLWFPSPLQ